MLGHQQRFHRQLVSRRNRTIAVNFQANTIDRSVEDNKMIAENKFVVDLAIPGFSDKILHEGLQIDLETVVVIVPDKPEHRKAHLDELGFTEPDTMEPAHQRSWRIPLKHLASVPFFEAAFRKDGFQEAETKTITLSDEHACAFEMFVTWLYRGFATGNNSAYDLIHWTCFYLMVDKWCMRDLARDTLLQMVNIMSGSKLTVADINDWAICYLLLTDHDARYVAVNSLVVAMPEFDLAILGPIFEKSNLGADFVRWNRIASFHNTCQQPYPIDTETAAVDMTRVPQFLAETLMPILYTDFPWPERLDEAFGRFSDSNNTRDYLRHMLDTGEKRTAQETSHKDVE